MTKLGFMQKMKKEFEDQFHVTYTGKDDYLPPQVVWDFLELQLSKMADIALSETEVDLSDMKKHGGRLKENFALYSGIDKGACPICGIDLVKIADHLVAEQAAKRKEFNGE